MEQIKLQVAPRVVLGKKVRFLRRQGIVPVHVFGHNVESLALQCDTVQLRRVLPQVGKTRLISLKVDNEAEPRNVMVREVQRHPISGGLLHVDLYQVAMAEKIKAAVPVVLMGEAPALKVKENMLVQELNEVTVECLPALCPARIEVDSSSLQEARQELKVKSIVLDKEIAILNDPEATIVRIVVRRVEKEEVVVAAAPEAVAAEAAAAPAAEEKAGEKGKE